MANYVSNRVICTKAFFDQYFLDPYSLGKDSYEYCKNHKYISFNKLFGVKDVGEYYDKYGEYVYYGHSYITKEINEDYIEVKFHTKHYYPICAIKKAIEINHDIKWYAFEENIIYISKFEWDKNKVVEKTLNIETGDFDKWYNKNIFNGNIYDEIDDSDDAIWYYDYDNKEEWIIWECNDLIKRYKTDYPVREYYEWYKEIIK